GGREPVEEGALGEEPVEVRSEAGHVSSTIPNAMNATVVQGDLGVVRRLLPYLWEFRGRVLLALAFLVSAKLANILVPLVMKRIVDGLSGPQAIVAVPVALLAAYGLLRMSSTVFNE